MLSSISTAVTHTAISINPAEQNWRCSLSSPEIILQCVDLLCVCLERAGVSTLNYSVVKRAVNALGGESRERDEKGNEDSFREMLLSCSGDCVGLPG